MAPFVETFHGHISVNFHSQPGINLTSQCSIEYSRLIIRILEIIPVNIETTTCQLGSAVPFCCNKSPRQRNVQSDLTLHFRVGGYQFSSIYASSFSNRCGLNTARPHVSGFVAF